MSASRAGRNGFANGFAPVMTKRSLDRHSPSSNTQTYAKAARLRPKSTATKRPIPVTWQSAPLFVTGKNTTRRRYQLRRKKDELRNPHFFHFTSNFLLPLHAFCFVCWSKFPWPCLIRKHSNIYSPSRISARQILRISFSNTEARFRGAKLPTLARSALRI